jgi:RHS repeat-associated protein
VIWDGDQILYEIRAQGGNVATSQLEDDNAQGPFYGRVAYTHGTGIDAPLEIIRMGYTPVVDASYGMNAWGGPYPVMPYTDWHGVMDGATTATGSRIPCNTTPNLCSPGIWPASNLGAYYEPQAPADQQAWFGSLTTGKTDGSGFVYMRNRYYNPQTGTFTQPDPIGLAGGLNVYGFAEGDPITFSDPFGLDPCSFPIPDVKECIKASALKMLEAGVTGWKRIASMLPGGLSLGEAATGQSAETGTKLSGGARMSAAGMAAVDLAPDVPVGKVFRTYREARAVTRGYRGAYQAHHIVEARHLANWGLDAAEGPAVILTRSEHQEITNTLQRMLPTGSRYSRERVWAAYQVAYRNHPEWMAAIASYFR